MWRELGEKVMATDKMEVIRLSPEKAELCRIYCERKKLWASKSII